MDPLFTADNLIYSYSRAQAIEDGVLIDVSETAREAGIRFPVAMTAEAWAATVTWTRSRETALQDESGRLWDVVWMLRMNLGRARGDTLLYTVLVVPNTGRGHKARPVKLKAVCGPGDDMAPIITVMLPEED